MVRSDDRQRQVGITVVTATPAAEEVSKFDEGEDGDGDWGPVMRLMPANWDDARRQNVSFFSLSSAFILPSSVVPPGFLPTPSTHYGSPCIATVHASHVRVFLIM